jgi:hypothetical protein
MHVAFRRKLAKNLLKIPVVRFMIAG